MFKILLILLLIPVNLTFAEIPDNMVEDSLTLERFLTFGINNLQDITHISFFEIAILGLFVFLFIGIPIIIIFYLKRKSKK